MPIKKMDSKLIAYKQPYEVADVCRLFKIKKKDFLILVKMLDKKHSKKMVYDLLIDQGYTKHPRKKK